MGRSGLKQAAVAIAAAVLTGLLAGVGPAAAKTSPPPPKSAHPIDAKTALAGQPLRFEVNQGQFDPEVRFLARGKGYNLFLSATEAVLVTLPAVAEPASPVTVPRDELGQLSSGRDAKPTADLGPPAVVRMGLDGVASSVQLEGVDRLGGVSNYLVGNDPALWSTDVPSFAGVRYRGVYPGVDLVFYDSGKGLEYDFEVSPGADPAQIGLKFTGAEPTVDETGDLVLGVGAGAIRQSKPVLYQGAGSDRREVTGAFALGTGGRAAYSVGAYDRSQLLVIDPVITYSTYIGSGEPLSFGQFPAIATDGAGNVYLTGTTSTSFPTKGAPAYDTSRGGLTDRFVTKLNTGASGASALVWSTYLGGTGSESGPDAGQYGVGIAIDGSGNVVVTGTTRSTDFPTTSSAYDRNCGTDGSCNGVDTGYSGGRSISGSKTYSTDSTTTGFDRLHGSQVGLGISGANIPAGSTIAAIVDNATIMLSAPATASGSGLSYVIAKDHPRFDGFVTKLVPTGSSLAYSSYLGGSGNDVPNGLALGPGGRVYLSGSTDSADLPVTSNAMDSTFAGPAGLNDVFLAVMDTAGSGVTSLTYSSYLGGTSGDKSSGLAVDAAGRAYLTGITDSGDFPVTPGAYQSVLGGRADLFVAKVDTAVPGPGGLLFATYLGGNGTDLPAYYGAIAVDGSGNAYVTGVTESGNFPVTAGAYDTSHNGPVNTAGSRLGDGFVAKVNTNAVGAASLAYSTFLGGSGENPDWGMGIAVGGDGLVTVVGQTPSADFPQVRPMQPYTGRNAFVAQLDMGVPGAGGLVFSTFLGGDSMNEAHAVAVQAGSPGVYVAGSTSSSDFPTTLGAYQEGPGGSGTSLFLTRIDPTRDALLVTGSSPSGGPTTGGTPVVVTGKAFTDLPVTGVRFGSVPAASFRVDSATQLTAVTPACSGCTTANVTVSTVSGPSVPSRFVYGEGAFAPTAACSSPACDGPLVTLASGKVLAVAPEGQPSQVYDPATATWAPTGACPAGCGGGHSATLSVLDDGRVLLAGGESATGTSGIAAASVYNPASGTWSAVNPMNIARQFHTATVLSTGKVLVAGGCSGQCISASAAELFNPADGSWSVVAGMAENRFGHTATRLTGPACRTGTAAPWCNKVLVVGGRSDSGVFSATPLRTAELYDPATGLWEAAGTTGMSAARFDHSTTLLDGPACAGAAAPTWCGRVVVAGGGPVSSEVYNPAAIASGRWGSVAPLSLTRTRHVAVQVPSGKVILAGGEGNSTDRARGEVYDPATVLWSSGGGLGGGPTGPKSAVLIPPGPTSVCGTSCGKVLMATGFGPVNAELYTPRPSVTTVAPASGAPGSTVTVTGSGLASVTSASFGTVAAPVTHDQSTPESTLRAVVPPGAASSAVPVTVSGPGGVSPGTPASTFTYAAAAIRRAAADFNGDNRSDIAVYRPNGNAWFVQGGLTTAWGAPGDVAVPADYDGDGRTDVAVFRPSDQTWYVQGGLATQWGRTGDVPIPGDYDGDGKADIAVYRPSDQTWYVKGGLATQWGRSGDIPVPADYNGDGKMDIAVYRPSDQTWYVQGGLATQWGVSGDLPVPVDFNGDGKTDVAVFRPSDRTWYSQGAGGIATQWGANGDVAVPGDYNGDGRADVAVFRKSDATWYVQGGTATQWGTTGDVPVVVPAHLRSIYGL